MIVWDARKNVKLNEMSEVTSTVTSLATHDERTVAVGYKDGTARCSCGYSQQFKKTVSNNLGETARLPLN